MVYHTRMKPQLYIGNKNYSSWSLRSWLLLREAGIEFDEHRILLDEDTTAAEITAVSPGGTVPALRIGDLTVWDTMAIAETVAERWPEKNLWPEDPDVRAFARSICAEMHSGFHELRQGMPMNCRAMGRKVALPDILTDDIDRIIAIWSECHNKYSGDSGWLFGHFTIADAMYAPVLPESAGCFTHRVLGVEAMQDWLAAAECEIEVIEREEKGR